MNIIAVLRFLGAGWAVVGASILVSLIPAFWFGDGGVAALAATGGITVGVGLASLLFTTKQELIRTKEAFLSVALVWITAPIVGAIPFTAAGLLGFTDALFEAVSGFTTTGASVVADIESWPHGLVFWRSMTHALGGMGIVAMSVALLPILGFGGVELFQTEVVGPLKDKLTPRVRETARALWLIYTGLIATQTILYVFGGMSWFDSICHSFGTMATGGFSTKNASIGFYQSHYITWVTTVFMLLGGANFALHFMALRGRSFVHAKDFEFRFYFAIVSGAIGLIYLGNIAGSPRGWFDVLEGAAFSVASIVTTTGYVTEDFNLWGPASRFILLLLTFTGSCAGSTAGSVKMIRWGVAFKAIRLQLRRNVHPHAILPLRIGGKLISDETVRAILLYIVAYCGMVAMGSLSLMMMGIEVDSAIAGTAICASNTGAGQGLLGSTDTFTGYPAAAKYILSLEMLLGRLEIFALLIIFSRGFWRT